MGTRVFINGLSEDVTVQHLEKFFKGYGIINEISLRQGFALLDFEDFRDADDAVFELNNKDLLGKRVHLEYARSYRELPKKSICRRTNFTLIVENLSSEVSWQDLKDHMRQAGEVIYADAHKKKKHVGMVDFATYDDMKSAKDNLNNTELNGRRITLKYKSSRSRSRSRSSHSRSSSSRSRSPLSTSSRSYSRSRSKSPVKDHSSRSIGAPKQSQSQSSNLSKNSEIHGSCSQSKFSKSTSRARSRSRSKSSEKTSSSSSPVIMAEYIPHSSD